MSEKTQIVIKIDPHGTVHALHYDNFDLGFLGPKKIERASEILFDEPDQTFYVQLPGFDTVELFAPAVAFGSYNEARKFEVYLLENAAFNSIAVEQTPKFEHFADVARRRWDGLDQDKRLFVYYGGPVVSY